MPKDTNSNAKSKPNKAKSRDTGMPWNKIKTTMLTVNTYYSNDLFFLIFMFRYCISSDSLFSDTVIKKLRELTHARTHTNTHTHTHTCLTALCPGLPKWASAKKVKPIWILLKQESGINWAICKPAPRSRQITTTAPHHSVFYRPDAISATQPTASKYWR